MIIIMKSDADERDIQSVKNILKRYNLEVHTLKNTPTKAMVIIGDENRLSDINIELLHGVEKCIPILHSYKLASRDIYPNGRLVKVEDEVIGGNKLLMIAGPCAVESEEQMFTIAEEIKKTGTHFLRGGAYKPRTSPYAFQGLEEEGLKLLRNAADANGLKVVSEIVSENFIDSAAKYCDVVQIGARNMQNFELLKAVGKAKIPVLLKRGISSTIEEWLDAAEYIMSEGNYNVILCERGIRTFETATRNTLDISAVAVVKEKSSLPIIVDPSHAAGKSSYIRSLSLAAVAAGADGLIVEVHPDPKEAISDAAQQITPREYGQLLSDVKKVASAVNRSL